MKTTAEIKIIALRPGQLPLVTAVCQRALGQPVNLTHLSEDEERIVGNMNRQEARRWLAKTRPVLFHCPHCTLEELRDVETDESGVWHRPTTHVVGFDPPRECQVCFREVPDLGSGTPSPPIIQCGHEMVPVHQRSPTRR